MAAFREDMEPGVKKELYRYYRLELVSHMGYIVSTIVASIGLFNFDTFLQFASTHWLIVPIVVVAIFALLTHFVSRAFHLTRARVVFLNRLIHDNN